MDNEKIFVLTVFGHDKTVDSIKIKSFENYNAASEYCYTITDLETKNDSWVTARTISENTQYPLGAFLPFTFDIILSLDDRSIQKLMMEIDSWELIKAMKGGSDAVKEKIFKNMSKRAAIMLKEDIEYMGAIPSNISKRNQKIIMSILRHLEDVGEIVINYTKGETVK